MPAPELLVAMEGSHSRIVGDAIKLDFLETTNGWSAPGVIIVTRGGEKQRRRCQTG
jgi:hypothetical protein